MGRILIKFGGGVITSKSTGEPEVKTAILNSLIDATIELVKLGNQVIVVHGTGSFGHVVAKRWDLSSGFQSEHSSLLNEERLEAVEEVRSNMDDLCGHIFREFHVRMQAECGSLDNNPTRVVHTTRHTPREFARNTGYDFAGDLDRFIDSDEYSYDALHLTHGDVVDCDGAKGFGILSGDHIMYRLATELPDVTHCIFAMDESGILTKPDGSGELIPRWNSEMGLNGVLDEKLDVTGGIFLKADVASRISEYVEHVWFIDGKRPERLVQVVENGDTIGTRIIPP